MRKRTNVNPLVFIIGAALLVALMLALLYLLNRASSEPPADEMPAPSPVGLHSEPDSEGWKPLFNETDLTGWEITNFGPQGHVYVSRSEIILGAGDGCTGITWNKEFPVNNYEISLEAKRVDGYDFFCGLTIPVFSGYCTFVIGGWGGSTVGISSIDGEDASENFTSFHKHFNDHQWYKIGVIVDSLFLKCFIDDELVINVPVNDHKFSVRSEVLLSIPLGITSWRTTAALRDVKFRVKSNGHI